MKIMNFLLPAILTAGLNTPLYAQNNNSMKRINTLEGIAMVVNSDVITYSELRRALSEAGSTSKGKKSAASAEEAINMLVVERLQTQIAERNNIKIGEDEIDRAITEIAKRNNATIEMLQTYLRQSNQSVTNFRDNIRKQIIAARVRDGVMQGVKITNNDVDMFMLTAEFQNVMKQMQQERITQTHVKHILVRVSKDLTDEKAMLRARRLYERIINGEDFELLARAQSDDPVSAAKGGDLGWVAQGQLEPEFEKEMNNIGLNQLSPIFRTPFGYHMIMVLERKEGARSDDMVRNTARAMLYNKKAAQVWAIWQDSLMNQAYIEKRF